MLDYPKLAHAQTGHTAYTYELFQKFRYKRISNEGALLPVRRAKMASQLTKTLMQLEEQSGTYLIKPNFGNKIK